MIFSFKNVIQISSVEWLVFLMLILVVFTVFRRFKQLAINIVVFLLGFAWMGVFSNYILDKQVKDIYINKAIIVNGVVVDLPENLPQKTKFIFKITSPFKAKVKLSWYKEELPILKTGDSWQLKIKLKHNNGYQNLGGFDYEKWLFYKQIDATGYVKTSEFNSLRQKSKILSIDEIRQNTRDFLKPFLTNLEFGGVLNALIIGDRSLIKSSNWELFKTTNTTHLSVISGLHIGLISGFIFLLTSFLWRRCSFCMLKIPAQVIGGYFGLISALLYALIAGFSIPTQRAFIMAGVVFLSLILRRFHNIWQLYGIALLLVLIINPVSVFSVGFWLSFYVVAIIIYGATLHKNKSWFYRLLSIQLLVSIATLPLVLWFFDAASMLSPVANLVAIPVFSFITIPLSLISALLAFINLSYLAQIIFDIANQSLIFLSYLLNYLQSFDFNLWFYTQNSKVDLILFVLAMLIFVLPRELNLRKFSLILLAFVLFSPTQKLDKGSVLITTLDVGQGLAVVAQTKNHTLLFDTGASFVSGFNMGTAVINPYFASKQIKSLDKIIISHGDIDHIGGLKSVLKRFYQQNILTSVPGKINRPTTLCQTGQLWRWDNVTFEILNPDKNAGFVGNNTSCVLKISTNEHSVLLTADIEKKAEKYLIKNHYDKLSSDVMLIPHHGSKTSSTLEFIKAINPKVAIVSNGFQNRFNHPSKKIMNRYNSLGIKVLKTSCTGQIDIKLDDKITVKEYRKDNAKYYIRQCEIGN